MRLEEIGRERAGERAIERRENKRILRHERGEK